MRGSGRRVIIDARDLEIGDYVGWGPGAKALGSQHTVALIIQVSLDDWNVAAHPCAVSRALWRRDPILRSRRFSRSRASR